MPRAEVLPSKTYRHPNQPTFVYNIDKPWEDMVAEPPIWLGQFPPKPTEKKYTLFGQPTISPLIIAAGPASGRLWTKFYLEHGYGAVIQKTRRTVDRRSNPVYNIAIVCSDEPITAENIDIPRLASVNPKDYKEYPSMTNSFGNPSSSIAVWTREYRYQRLDVEDGQLLPISVTPTVDETEEYSEQVQREKIIEDILIAIAAAVGAGAEEIEVNDACPNVVRNKIEGEMFQDEVLVRKKFALARRYFPGVQLGMKVGRFSSRDQAERIIDATGDNIDFYSTINALSVPVVDKDGNQILVGRDRAGTCGDILREYSLYQTEMIADIRSKRGFKWELHVGGGISKPEHIEQYRSAGGDGFFSGSNVLANPLLNNDYFYWLQEHS